MVLPTRPPMKRRVSTWRFAWACLLVVAGCFALYALVLGMMVNEMDVCPPEFCFWQRGR